MAIFNSYVKLPEGNPKVWYKYESQNRGLSRGTTDEALMFLANLQFNRTICWEICRDQHVMATFVSHHVHMMGNIGKP
jgi:hypothetical protein